MPLASVQDNQTVTGRKGKKRMCVKGKKGRRGKPGERQVLIITNAKPDGTIV
jgi:hypothetical protein